MSVFTQYDIATGELVAIGGGVGAIMPANDQTYGYIEGSYPSDSFWMDPNNGITQYTLQQSLSKANRPAGPARWSNYTMSWTSIPPNETSILAALAIVDELAGNARLRYITSVPGQAETYAKKEQQARDWQAAAFSGEAPPFILAEATALNISPQTLAEQVIALADFWANIKGPQIEATRRKWKVALEAATTYEQIDSLLEQARTEFATL